MHPRVYSPWALFEKALLYSCLLHFKFLCSLRKQCFKSSLVVTTTSGSLISPIALITLTAWYLANTLSSNLPQVTECRTLKHFLSIKNLACRSWCFKNTWKSNKYIKLERTLVAWIYHHFITIWDSHEKNPGCLNQFVTWGASWVDIELLLIWIEECWHLGIIFKTLQSYCP